MPLRPLVIVSALLSLSCIALAACDCEPDPNCTVVTCPSLLSTAAPPLLASVVGSLVLVAPDSAPSPYALALPTLTSVSGNVTLLDDAGLVGSLDLDALASVGGTLDLSDCPSLHDIDLTQLGSVGSAFVLRNNSALVSFEAPALASVGADVVVSANGVLAVLQLETVGSIGGALRVVDNALLATVDLTALVWLGGELEATQNPAWCDYCSLGALANATLAPTTGPPLFPFDQFAARVADGTCSVCAPQNGNATASASPSASGSPSPSVVSPNGTSSNTPSPSLSGSDSPSASLSGSDSPSASIVPSMSASPSSSPSLSASPSVSRSVSPSPVTPSQSPSVGATRPPICAGPPPVCPASVLANCSAATGVWTVDCAGAETTSDATPAIRAPVNVLGDVVLPVQLEFVVENLRSPPTVTSTGSMLVPPSGLLVVQLSELPTSKTAPLLLLRAGNGTLYSQGVAVGVLLSRSLKSKCKLVTATSQQTADSVFAVFAVKESKDRDCKKKFPWWAILVGFGVLVGTGLLVLVVMRSDALSLHLQRRSFQARHRSQDLGEALLSPTESLAASQRASDR